MYFQIHTRGFQKVSSHIFFLTNYWSIKIEKNTGRFVMKFSIFPCNPLANLNILYIVYVTFVNQRDSTQCANFEGTPQIVYFCSSSFKISYPVTHHRLTHTLFAVNCQYLRWIFAAVLPCAHKNRITLHNRTRLLVELHCFCTDTRPRVYILVSLFFSVTTVIYFTFPHWNFTAALYDVSAKKCVNLLFENTSYTYIAAETMISETLIKKIYFKFWVSNSCFSLPLILFIFLEFAQKTKIFDFFTVPGSGGRTQWSYRR